MTSSTHLQINYDNAQLSEQRLAAYEYALLEEINVVQAASKRMYETSYASINLSLDSAHMKTAIAMAKKYAGCTLLIVVGIGGSNLGTMAVQEALLGKQHNQHPQKQPRVLYADTVDPASMSTINELLTSELKKKNSKVVINLISKSGGTTETIANFEVLYATLKKYKKTKAQEYVVATTDEGSHLWHFAKQQKFKVLSMPKNVGGRYSVLSPVGLFPLALLGINIKKLMDGAANMRAACLRTTHAQNPAIIRAAIIKQAHESGHNICDNFYFRTDLECVGKWYRQLMGESIGKEYSKDGKRRVHCGLTPTVSIGSTDLHSMAQLYFGGPDDKLFTLVDIAQGNNKRSNKGTLNAGAEHVSVPAMHEYDALVPNIQSKHLSTIMTAIVDSVAIALQRKERPYCRITLDACDEESIGALLQLHMFEMIYLAALFGVNPFDQPNVEDYKVETKRILAGARR